MKKRLLASVIAAASLFTLTAGCGKESPSSSSSSVKKPSGKYCKLYPLDGNREYHGDPDKMIEYSKSTYEKLDNPGLEFDGKEFAINGVVFQYADNETEYNGTFKMKDGKIALSYENYEYYPKNSDKPVKVNINDEIEVDKDIVLGKSPELDGLSKEERGKRIGEEQSKEMTKARIETMQDMNETGTFAYNIIPPANASDKFNDYGCLPLFLDRSTYNFDTRILSEYPLLLESHGDILSRKIYGMELKGSYKKGKKFTVKFDPLAPISDDKSSIHNSIFNDMSKKELINYVIESDVPVNDDRHIIQLMFNLIGDLGEGEIIFDDGKWEWYNGKGDLVNNGTYQESKDYPGLIGMYVDEDSERYIDSYSHVCPHLFYIDGKDISYPCMVKMD